jgi:hypothetical protein
MGKYTVDITKRDGAKSKYFVIALTAGGAESAVLGDVYNSRYALASEGWPEGVNWPDLCTEAVKTDFITAGIKKEIAN